MENISTHITYDEATDSTTAATHRIANVPSSLQLANMKTLAEKVFEPLREGLGNKPIEILSFFRSVKVNQAVGGASTSQHVALNGAAMDIKGISCANSDLFHFIKENIDFDQLIWEFGDHNQPSWVHVSYNEGKNRFQVLRAVKIKGSTHYDQFV